MRAVLQRVTSASVSVEGQTVARLDGPGLVVLLGVTHDDGPTETAWMVRKIRDLRIMRDERSVAELEAPVLVVSQFTLYGDARKGRRPTWNAAAPGPVAEPVYLAVCRGVPGPLGDLQDLQPDGVSRRPRHPQQAHAPVLGRVLELLHHDRVT